MEKLITEVINRQDEKDRNKISQRELARQMGVSQPRICQIFNDHPEAVVCFKKKKPVRIEYQRTETLHSKI